MSECVVASWRSIRQQKQHKKEAQISSNRTCYVDLLDTHHHSFQQHHQQLIGISQMSNFEVTELTWENGQLAMHELGGIFPPPVSTTSSSSPKPTWEEDGGGCGGGVGDTLESIVHQATYCNKQVQNLMPEPKQVNFGSVVASSGGKWAEKPGQIKTAGLPQSPGMLKKRTRYEAEHRGLTNDHESACASANAVFSRENNETTMMTWSYESPRSSTRTKTTNDEDSACHGSENHEVEREKKGETGRSYPTRKGRAAAVHNQSERRRRDRINQKMKALQKLVPNSSKTDKASMLDEVIEYLKQLQAQVQMMSQARFMPQIMMPLGIQQHLHQMSLLARMGMGANLGMGLAMPETPNIVPTPAPAPQPIPSMIHPSQVAAAAASTFVPPQAFMVPQMISATQLADPGTTGSAQLQDAYNTLLAQSMNLELCNRIAALQRQQQQMPSQPANNHLQPNHHVQRS